MAKKKPITLYEILMEKGRGLSGPAGGKPKAPRKAGGSSRKPSGGGGIGEKKIQLSLSLNALLGLSVVFVLLLAGMYGLGRYQALAASRGPSTSLASMEMGGGAPAAPRPSRRLAGTPSRTAHTAKAGRTGKAPARFRTVKGLCVISYGATSKGKKLALQMVQWLRSQGLEKTLYASDRGKSWMVVVPLGGESPQALRRRVLALKAPPFAERNFRFADQKMYFVTLRVKE